MKATELRKKSIHELNKLIIDQSMQTFKMRLQKGLGEAPKPHQVKLTRRIIARIHTIITEKERQA